MSQYQKIFDYKSEISDDLEDKAAEIYGYKDITRAIKRSLIRRFLVGGVEACKWLCSERKCFEMYTNLEEDLVNLSFQFKNIVCLKWAFDNNLKYDVPLPRSDILNSMKRDLHITDNKLVLIAGSTHEGEEVIILNSYYIILLYNNII